MEKGNQSSLREIFNQALELAPGADRDQFLAQACSNNADLRRRVEELIQAHDRAAGFLEKTPPAAAAKGTIVLQLPLTEKPGDRIGRYKILQQIGEGGCGVVYMAEQ